MKQIISRTDEKKDGNRKRAKGGGKVQIADKNERQTAERSLGKEDRKDREGRKIGKRRRE